MKKHKDHAIGCQGVKTAGFKVSAELPDSRINDLIYAEKTILTSDRRKRRSGRKNPEYCTLCTLDPKGHFMITFNVRTNRPSFYIEKVRYFLSETWDRDVWAKLFAVFQVCGLTLPYLDILDRETSKKLEPPSDLQVRAYVEKFQEKIKAQRRIWRAWLKYHVRHRPKKH